MRKNIKSYGIENDQNLKLLIALTRTTQAVHKRSGNIFEQGGLTTAQFSVLEALYHKGEMTISEIMKTILSTPGNMTVVIKNLEKEKHITKKENPEDKRATLIRITEKGNKLIENIFPKHIKDLEDCFSTLSSEEKENIIKLLKKLTRKP
ncbi:MAG: MarR family transcriptional regulator [Fusobacteria bacterium]|nr:MAG: MarR family transcriptional regulator [Fusobacteriota bacterium]KAF0228597.1 MAG: MarR family transcriptional [Fusobacteriota bacterium]